MAFVVYWYKASKVRLACLYWIARWQKCFSLKMVCLDILKKCWSFLRKEQKRTQHSRKPICYKSWLKKETYMCIYVHGCHSNLRGLGYLGIGYLRRLLGETVVLSWHQVIAFSADIFIGIVQTTWTGPWRRPGAGWQRVDMISVSV